MEKHISYKLFFMYYFTLKHSIKMHIRKRIVNKTYKNYKLTHLDIHNWQIKYITRVTLKKVLKIL